MRVLGFWIKIGYSINSTFIFNLNFYSRIPFHYVNICIRNQLLLIYQKEKNSRYSVIFSIFLYQQFHYLLLNRSNNVRVFIIFHTIHRPWKYWTQLNTLFVDGSGHLKTFCVHHTYICQERLLLSYDVNRAEWDNCKSRFRKQNISF